MRSLSLFASLILTLCLLSPTFASDPFDLVDDTLTCKILSRQYLPNARDAALVSRQFYRCVVERGYVYLRYLKDEDSDEGLREFLLSRPKLLHFDPGYGHLKYKLSWFQLLAKVTARFPDLQTLKLDGQEFLNPNNVTTITTPCKGLRCLNLSGLKDFTLAGFETIFTNNPKIDDLNLERTELNVPFEFRFGHQDAAPLLRSSMELFYFNLAEKLPNLQKLALSGFCTYDWVIERQQLVKNKYYEIPLKELMALVHKLPRLHEISLASLDLPDRQKRGRCDSKFYIRFEGVGAERRTIPFLEAYPSKHWQILTPIGLSFLTIQALCLGPPLKTLHLSRQRYTAEELDEIAVNCTHLESLRIGGIGVTFRDLDDPTPKVRTEDILNKIPTLDCLMLEDDYRNGNPAFWRWIGTKAKIIDLADTNSIDYADVSKVLLQCDLVERVVLYQGQLEMRQKGLLAREFPQKSIKLKPRREGICLYE